jgi:succinyl-CoA synthetase alpha subunit
VVVVGLIKKGAYFDSVTLMKVGKALTAMDGVVDAAVVMGTDENKAILEASDLLTPEFQSARGTDLLIGVSAESDEAAQRALDSADGHLKAVRAGGDDGEEFHPASLTGALTTVTDANLALISVAGRYAGLEARRALDAGLNVMLFSDNVPIETEVELKTLAHERGLIVMGPDCGTAIVNGVPLAFANVVNRGDIGIVAASGTGLQEVSCIISNEGAGVSQAIGTGGRDVKDKVGGISFIDGLAALAEDDATRVIVLVSKPPDDSVRKRIGTAILGIEKPVVRIFLGAEPEVPTDARTLEEAALKAVALSREKDPREVDVTLESRDAAIWDRTELLAQRCGESQCYVRALMSGGTFAAEAQVLFSDAMKDIASNVPTAGAHRLSDPNMTAKNTVIDFGADEFTVGRPHPMIDYSLRKKRMAAEADDPETAVILLDVVLGYGSHPDPSAELADVIAAASDRVIVICSVTGTDQDPQDRRVVERELTDAGAIVTASNAAACKEAAYVIKWLAGR